MAALPPRRAVMMMEQEWPALEMSAILARNGLLSDVIVQKEPADELKYNLRGLGRSGPMIGWRRATEAYLGFRHGWRHSLGRLRDRRAHPVLRDLSHLGVKVHQVPAFLSESCHEL